jgi:hypothetical protein
LCSSTVILWRFIAVCIRAWHLRYWNCFLRLGLNYLSDNSINNVDELLANDKVLHHIEQEAETIIRHILSLFGKLCDSLLIDCWKISRWVSTGLGMLIQANSKGSLLEPFS